MTMNPFEQSRQQLLHYLTSNAEQESCKQKSIAEMKKVPQNLRD